VFESSFSGRKFDLLEEMSERGIETVESTLTASRCDRPQRAGGAKGARVNARVEHRDLGTGRGDAIPVTVLEPFNEAVQPEPAEIILMVVSVRRAWPSLWYCLTLDFLYCTWSDGTTPSVSTRVRKLPGVAASRRFSVGKTFAFSWAFPAPGLLFSNEALPQTVLLSPISSPHARRSKAGPR
jgi:hypothetical protein